MRRQTLLALALVALAGGAQATTVDLLEACAAIPRASARAALVTLAQEMAAL